MAVAAPAAVPVRTAGVIAVLVTVALGPRAVLAQVRSVANEAIVATTVTVSSSSATAAWEDALASGVVDPDVWSAIGRRLHVARQYRECIAALERSLVLRMRHTRIEDDLIADAYASLGNVKQARRWSSDARNVSAPPRLHESAGNRIPAGDEAVASRTRRSWNSLVGGL